MYKQYSDRLNNGAVAVEIRLLSFFAIYNSDPEVLVQNVILVEEGFRIQVRMDPIFFIKMPDLDLITRNQHICRGVRIPYV
jgi:hypothetical protein